MIKKGLIFTTATGEKYEVYRVLRKKGKVQLYSLRRSTLFSLDILEVEKYLKEGKNG